MTMIDQISIPLGSKSLDIQIGKLAKQADGAAVVRFGDTVVLATAVFSKEPKENAEFFPLTVDYREPTYAGRPDPRRLVQAGGPPHREGDPDLAPDRPADAAALPQGLQPRDADRRVRPLGRRPERRRHPRHQRRLRRADLLGRPVPLPGRRRPRRPSRRESSSSTRPTPSATSRTSTSSCAAPMTRSCMVEGGAREVSEQTLIDAILFGHEAVRQIVGAQVTLQRRGGFQKPYWQAPEAYPASVFSEVRMAWEAPMMAAMTLPNKIASYAEIKAVKKAAVSMVPEAEAEKRKQVAKAADDLVKVLTRETILGGQAPRRPGVLADPPDHLRGRHPSPHPRLGALHARRDAGPRDGDARDLRRRPDHRGVRGRERAHVPAALQLPALLGRRDQVHARAPRAATSATATSPAGRCPRCSPPRTRFRTPCGSCRTSSSPTAPPRWRRSAAERSPSWMRACRSRRRSRAWRWASSPTASASPS